MLQITLTANTLDSENVASAISRNHEQYDTSALIRDAVMSSLQDQEFAFMKRLWKSPSWQATDPAKEIFLEMLTASIIKKRDPPELAALLSMLPLDKNSIGWKEKTVLTGISIQGKNKMKPIRLASAPKITVKIKAVMISSKRWWQYSNGQGI